MYNLFPLQNSVINNAANAITPKPTIRKNKPNVRGNTQGYKK
jgi:hypothetical protein